MNTPTSFYRFLSKTRRLCTLALALHLPAMAVAQSPAVDGTWDFRLNCSVNAINNRPGFEWKARVKVQGGRFVHQAGAQDSNPYEETWNGEFTTKGNAAQLNLGAQGGRPNGDRWEFRFTPASVQHSEVELSGGVYGRNKGEEVRMRTCTAFVKRADSPVVSAPAMQEQSSDPAVKPVNSPSVANKRDETKSAPAPSTVAQAVATLSDNAQKQAKDSGKATAQSTTINVTSPTTAAPLVKQPSAPAASTAASNTKSPAVDQSSATAPATPVPSSTPAAVPSRVATTPTTAATSVVAQTPAQSAPAGAQPAAPKTGPRPPAELRKALQEDPGLDLALVVQMNGSGNLKRTLDGKWTVASGGVSVGTMEVLDSGVTYDLKGFANLAPGERAGSVRATPFYTGSLYYPGQVPGSEKPKGFSGPTPTVATGVSANPALRASASPPADLPPEKALKVALDEAVGEALTKAIGKPVSHGLVYQSSANVILVPRLKVDATYNPPRVEGQWITRIEKGDAVVLGYITQAQLRQALKSRQASVADANKQEADLLATLKNSPAAGPESLIGAITVRTGVNVKPCALKSELDLAPYLLKHEPIGAWITKGAPKWSHETPRGIDTAEALFDELKSATRCTAVFGRGPMIATLAAALDRDRVGNLVYPQPQPQKAVSALKAKALGFDDVAMMEFAESIGTRDPQQVKALKTFGITTKAGVDQARERLKKYDAQATSSLYVLVALLNDEAEARKQGVSIEKLQAVRAERAAKEAKAAEAAQKENDKRVAKDYPYAALLRCRIGTSTITLQACMTEGSVDTEIEVRNGSDYRMYKVYDVQSLGTWSGDGVAIDLRSNFAIKAQNASNSAVLDVVIRDRLSGNVKFQKSASKFGVIAVQN